jgi:hypothetical protein
MKSGKTQSVPTFLSLYSVRAAMKHTNENISLSKIAAKLHQV